jgi:oligopeptide/dipeptide ABC transporter ATP-binding protein
MSTQTPARTVLSVENLETTFFTDLGEIVAVDDISFELRAGETLGIVGESGSGKTVTAKSIMRLIPNPPGRITKGRVLFDGQDLTQLPERDMRRVRGNRIAMIFQEPMTALNPVFTVGWQIEEALKLHQPELKRAARRERAISMLEKVSIPSPRQRIDEYPHQLSGGMRQRVMIAMALACNPEILVADEPTTALDVTIQAQVLSLIRDLQRDLGTAVIFITHDLGVVAEICDRVVVMYCARVVEKGSVFDIFHRPLHPYTRALLRSIPRRGPKVKGARLPSIPGMVPQLTDLPKGCRFRGRCDSEQPDCAISEPELTDLGDGRAVRCFHPGEP